MHFTPATTYSPETGSNVVVIVPQAGYNCPGPTIPLPQASPASGQSGGLPPYHADLKSPDSGFNESCVSPLDASLPVSNFFDHSLAFRKKELCEGNHDAGGGKIGVKYFLFCLNIKLFWGGGNI